MNGEASVDVLDSRGARTVLLASADAALRGKLRRSLVDLRWNVREAGGGAEAIASLEHSRPEAMLMDSWLPDLEAEEFADHVRRSYPAIDLLRVHGGADEVKASKSPRRHELLHALREAQEDSASTALSGIERPNTAQEDCAKEGTPGLLAHAETRQTSLSDRHGLSPALEPVSTGGEREKSHGEFALPGLIGASSPMRGLARMIRLVAPRSTAVLIEGETGSGKEVVAKAIHALSSRAAKPYVVLNCAAIPEALLEAELFGHTRGAFTGAVQSRTGRIEAADGGTLFLDEIGEMPIALQAKMLRFLDCGELQRVGENEPVRVDVRVLAATHQLLEERSANGTFRLDLYHRLAAFPIEVPALRDRKEDLELLSLHFLERLGQEAPRKRLTAAAMRRLREHTWPGNVRELMHVLERGAILCGNRAEIDEEDITFGRRCGSVLRG